MSEKKSMGCMPVVVIVVILISMLAGGTWYSKKQYKSKQAQIQQELAALPEFDEVAVGKEIAEERGLKYPVPESTMTPEEIVAQAKKEAEDLTKKKFTLKNYSKKQSEFFKKYRVAKNGDTVSFIMNTTGKTITGSLKGVFKDHKGRFVKVGIHEYRFPDIMEDYLYLFDSVIASKMASAKLKKLRKIFKGGKSKFRLNVQAKKTEKLYKNSGYTRGASSWITNSEYLKNELAKREKKHIKSIAIEKKKIYEQNKLFGLIDVQMISIETKKEE